MTLPMEDIKRRTAAFEALLDTAEGPTPEQFRTRAIEAHADVLALTAELARSTVTTPKDFADKWRNNADKKRDDLD